MEKYFEYVGETIRNYWDGSIDFFFPDRPTGCLHLIIILIGVPIALCFLLVYICLAIVIIAPIKCSIDGKKEKNRKKRKEQAEKEQAESEKWKEQAEKGNAEAQYKLGVYLMKQWKPREAIEWFKKAEAQGHKEAKEAIEKHKKEIEEKEIRDKERRKKNEEEEEKKKYRTSRIADLSQKAHQFGLNGKWAEGIKCYREILDLLPPNDPQKETVEDIIRDFKKFC